MGKLIGDEGIMLIAINRQNGRPLYPVFKPDMALDMLKHWQLPKPLKWSVYQDDNTDSKSNSKVHPINQEMRYLLAYAKDGDSEFEGSEECIEDEQRQRSAWYSALTSDFYLR